MPLPRIRHIYPLADQRTLDLRFLFPWLALWPAIATAQTGTIIDNRGVEISTGKTFSQSEQRQLMDRFAACTVRRWKSGVVRYLASAPGSPEAEDMAKRLASDECLASGQIEISEPLYRAAAYEVMYRINFGRKAVSDFSSVPPINYAQSGKASPSPDLTAQATLRRLADCAVRQAPVEAQTLILSPIGGSEEAAAFSVITPFMSSCMASDATVTFSKLSLRGFVGEVLYRLSVAARHDQG